ncbi:type II secretion system F family protein [Parahaliea sp. F7430]|uniref:Type II secretion system F family protein n=1 Tax=Sediminihaliea albiluteola TaxID=2758564 RepID=A0A7W2TYF2_9GAMM|nr:type II secretion system F family protein [Sediminihaliea albiluteola]MBA6414265.1 type II secretion system F family protein [Sediminihaliea albiluteola]
MPHFSYKAIGRDGKTVDGSIEADGLEIASRQLRSQGFTLLKIEPGTGAAGAVRKSAKAPGRQEVLSMTSELAVLLRAGLPLDRALKVLIDMAAEPALNELLSELLKDVKGGKALSQALLAHEQVFGSFYINMVRSGEASGQLSAVLDRLVEYLENAKANRDSVVSALIYPAILLVVSLLSIVLMLGFVVPQFESLFEDMGEGLPALTQAVISGADFIKDWGWLVLIGLIGGGLYLRSWLRTDAGRASFHRRLLKLPLAGGIIFEFEVSKFARTVGTLLGNGVSLLKAISIAIDTVENTVIRDALMVLPPAVKAGQRMSVALEETGLFTPMVIQMTRVGEESGSLGHMMLELAKVFDDHVQSGVKRGLTLLEPVLILGMGAVIAVIIIAILMGILSVNDLAA